MWPKFILPVLFDWAKGPLPSRTGLLRKFVEGVVKTRTALGDPVDSNFITANECHIGAVPWLGGSRPMAAITAAEAPKSPLPRGQESG
jgi:hypothetical protein